MSPKNKETTMGTRIRSSQCLAKGMNGSFLEFLWLMIQACEFTLLIKGIQMGKLMNVRVNRNMEHNSQSTLLHLNKKMKQN